MTKMQKIIYALIFIGISVAVIVATMPSNVKLLCLAEDRRQISWDAVAFGWEDPGVIENWEDNLDKVQEVAHSSAYGNFIANASDSIQITAVCVELVVIIAALSIGIILIRSAFQEPEDS